MSIRIRPYRTGDADDLADLYARSVRHFGPRAYSAVQVNAWAATISPAKLASRAVDGRIVLIAEDEHGRPLGFGDLEPDGHLDFLYCAPEAAGRGVGSLIYAALEDHARHSGIERIVVEASELARPLFERKGFAVVQRNDLTICSVAIHNFSMVKSLR